MRSIASRSPSLPALERHDRAWLAAQDVAQGGVGDRRLQPLADVWHGTGTY
jgi:hypothetical protein